MLLTEIEATDRYNQMLDEVYPEATLGVSTFSPHQILWKMDRVAYNEGFQDYVNSLAEDGTYVEGYTDEAYEENIAIDMDGDHDSAMASAGFGTDEDYGFSHD